LLVFIFLTKIGVDRVHNSVDWTWGGLPWTSGCGSAHDLIDVRSRRHCGSSGLATRRLGTRGDARNPFQGSLVSGQRWEGEVGGSDGFRIVRALRSKGRRGSRALEV
jgi:hypothetical protein